MTRANGGWRLHLEQARAFHEAARRLTVRATAGQNAFPILSQIAQAARAYALATTSKASGADVSGAENSGHAASGRQRSSARSQPRRAVVHRSVVAMLTGALGHRLPAVQRDRLESITRGHHAADGARLATLGEARALLQELDELAAWAETEVAR